MKKKLISMMFDLGLTQREFKMFYCYGTSSASVSRYIRHGTGKGGISRDNTKEIMADGVAKLKSDWDYFKKTGEMPKLRMPAEVVKDADPVKVIIQEEPAFHPNEAQKKLIDGEQLEMVTQPTKPKNPEECQFCYYCSGITDEDRNSGTCRYDPPVIIETAKKSTGKIVVFSHFPVVAPDWWCGKFREAR
jgi:hypothetical protein